MKIYIAIPYSNIDHEYSFKIANQYAAKLMNEGHIVFSPISHSHIIARDYGLPKDWEFWEKIDTEFIKWCDEVHVICIDGWEVSIGVQAELEIAQSLGKKIVKMYVADRYGNLLNIAISTLKENLHLCDGEECTLKELRDAVAIIEPDWRYK